MRAVARRAEQRRERVAVGSVTLAVAGDGSVSVWRPLRAHPEEQRVRAVEVPALAQLLDGEVQRRRREIRARAQRTRHRRVHRGVPRRVVRP